jgi:hypothetical protein
VRRRLSHFLNNRLTDGGEVVSLTLLTSRNISGTHSWLSRSLGHSAAGRIRSTEKSMIPSGIEPATLRFVA